MNSGYAIDEVLDLSFEQIKVIAECIIKHKVFMINAVAEPLSQAIGGKPTKKANKRAFKDLSPEAKDAMKLSKLRSMGFKV